MKKIKRTISIAIFCAIAALILSACILDVKYTVTFRSDGEVYRIVEVKKGETVTLPEDPIKEGYRFYGWYDAETGGYFLSTTKIESNFILDARWTKIPDVEPPKPEENLGNLLFTPIDGGYKVSVRTLTDATEIIVPDSYEGEAVIEIDNNFRSCYRLESLTIPFVGKSLTKTQDDYFGYIFGMSFYYSDTDYYIPDTLREVTVTGGASIGEHAFYNCSDLVKIVIPESIASIDSYAFIGCDSLTEICVDLKNQNYSSADGILYDDIKTRLITYPAGKDGEVQIPESVERIEQYAFSRCLNIVSMMIPKNVKSIGRSAFLGCSNLTAITIPFIGETLDGTDNAFFGYIFGAGYRGEGWKWIPQSLKEVTVIDGKNIESYAFDGCSGLTKILLPENTETIGEYAFAYCSGLTEITFSEGLRTIGKEAFVGCGGLTSIMIPKSVTGIETYYGSASFYDCKGLTEIGVDPDNQFYSAIDGILYDKAQTKLLNCPAQKSGVVEVADSVKYIGSGAFAGCSALTEVIIPESVKEVGYRSFYGCGGLTEIVVPNSVYFIGYEAFFDCIGLASVTLPFVGCGGVGEDETFDVVFGLSDVQYVFYGNRVPASLRKAVITGGTKLNDNAFTECRGLTEIDLPESLESIGSMAFYACINLIRLTIPKNVAYIASTAFDYCQALAEISVDPENQYYSSIDGIIYNKEQTVLFICPRGKTGEIFLPDGVLYIGNRAFYQCIKFTAITISASVERIGSQTFYYCPNLTSIKVDLQNENFSAIDGILYDKSITTLIKCPDKKSGEVIVPNGVDEIGSDAFAFCNELTRVELPESVESIGGYAFSHWTSGQTIYIAGRSSAPNGWSSDWSVYCDARIVWNA
ncbi:MAG: leucine-rich repeat protein [Clostridiales bacterium]|jgi:hypothetical protein|nr:leucine-rich repeat protein [Clostridiales bacterium]